ATALSVNAAHPRMSSFPTRTPPRSMPTPSTGMLIAAPPVMLNSVAHGVHCVCARKSSSGGMEEKYPIFGGVKAKVGVNKTSMSHAPCTVSATESKAPTHDCLAEGESVRPCSLNHLVIGLPKLVSPAD